MTRHSGCALAVEFFSMNQRKSIFRYAVAILAVVMYLAASALAGDMEPSAPPAPTMKTLDQVEPRRPISSVPFTITDSGAYYLTGDLTTTGSGITVNADDVSIDLMGHSLVGPGSGSDTGIYMSGRRNIRIRNGTVRNFGSSGIVEIDYTAGLQHRVINVRAVSNGYGIELYGEGHLVRNCSANDNRFEGIAVGNGSTVAGNLSFKNQGTGIYAESGCTVSGNTVYNNLNGVSASSGCTVTGNTTYDNQGTGIWASASTITGNTVHNNQESGIFAWSDCAVAGNTVLSNNLSEDAFHAGIRVTYKCFVRNNTVNLNNQSNICVAGYWNSIEGNMVTGSAVGIQFLDVANFYAKNRAFACTIPYANTADNTDGGNNFSR